MSYRDESALLARELAHLAATGSSTNLDRGGLDVALAGRGETLALLRQVLTDTTGISRYDTGADQRPGVGGVRRSVEELEAHPVGMLSQHWPPTRRRGRRPRCPTSSLHRPGRRTPEWPGRGRGSPDTRCSPTTNGPPTRRGRDPDQQWSAVGDVAALAQVVAVLDRHLHTAARARPDGDPAVVEALLERHGSVPSPSESGGWASYLRGSPRS